MHGRALQGRSIVIMGLLGVHNDLLVEEKQLVVVEEEVGKQAEERDMTAVLAAFPEYKSILLETQVQLSALNPSI